MARNARLGELLDEGICSVAKKQRKSVSAVEKEIAAALGYSHHNIQRWRRGCAPQQLEQVVFLTRYCTKYGRVDRGWASSLLTQARYPDRESLLQELFGNLSLRTAASQNEAILQNLPARSGEFLGRQTEMAQVIEGLTSRWPIISIEGMGGMGKTTLAIESARACLPGSSAGLDVPFEACVFISAKDQPIVLNDLLETVARVLNYPYIIQQIAPAQRPAEVERLLRTQRVLIIADNFETVTDKALVDYLQQVPEPSKVLVTTRHSQLRRVWDVPLKGLPESEALELIRRHARRLRLSVMTQAADETLKPLAAVTGGNPYALEIALGYLKYESLALDRLVNALHQAGDETQEIFDYVFKHAWKLLNQDARALLMVMPFFIESAGKNALGAAAGVEGFYLDRAIGQLVEMSLLEVNGTLEESHQRYSTHPLTLAFSGIRLCEVPKWEEEARERWSNYYLHCAEQYGDDDLGEDVGGGKLGHREKLRDEVKNFQQVIDWCFLHQSEKAVYIVEKITTFLYDEGEWAIRLHLCLRALEVAKTCESKAGLLTRVAWSYLVQGDYEQARKAYDEGLEIARHPGIQHRLVQLLREFGDWYCRQKEYTQAYRLYTESLELAEKIGQEVGIMLGKACLGQLAHESGDFQKARQIFRDLLSKREKAYGRLTFIIQRWLGEIAIAENHFDEAHTYLTDVEGALKSYYDADTDARLQELWGDWARATDRVDKAHVAYEKALDLATRLGMREEMSRLKNKLQNIDEQL